MTIEDRAIELTKAIVDHAKETGGTVEQASFVALVHILAFAERQTALLERIAAALAPDGASQPEKNDTPYAPAHERGV